MYILNLNVYKCILVYVVIVGKDVRRDERSLVNTIVYLLTTTKLARNIRYNTRIKTGPVRAELSPETSDWGSV